MTLKSFKPYTKSTRTTILVDSQGQVISIHEGIMKWGDDLIVSEIKNNAEKIDLTKGEQERDFINVVDVASAVAKIVTENGAYYEEYEVGTGNITNLKEFAKLVKKLANSSTKLNFGIKEYRDFEIMKLNTDSTKLKKLGWSPSLSLEEGISQMLDNF